MSTSMAIELVGGPADGMILAVADTTKIWVVPMPHMTPAQLIALENGGALPESVFAVTEYAYVYSARFGRRSSARLFTYAGPRHRTR
jgi:hypothetical protein